MVNDCSPEVQRGPSQQAVIDFRFAAIPDIKKFKLAALMRSLVPVAEPMTIADYPDGCTLNKCTFALAFMIYADSDSRHFQLHRDRRSEPMYRWVKQTYER